MLKRWLILPFVALMIIFMSMGCDEEPAASIDPPSALQLAGATNETDLVLTWSASPEADIDGYRVYFGTTELGTVTATTYNHVGPTALGTYKVVAYKDEEESAEITASTALATGTGEIYDLDAPVGDNSGYGWNWSTGVGTSYSGALTSPDYQSIDIYYDTDGTITSGSIRWTGGNVTGLQQTADTYDNIGNADLTGYTDYADVGLNQVYLIVIKKTYTDQWSYMKLRIDATASSPYNKINFTYGYQKVKNFSLLD